MRRTSDEHTDALSPLLISLHVRKKCPWLLSIAVALVLSSVVASSTYAASTWFVDASAAPGGDGLLWSTAFRYLKDGIGAAQSGDEIWVAQGTYRPDQPGVINSRSETFSLLPNRKIYGGFPTGGGGGTFGVRNPEVYTTTLSGVLNTVNSYHVVTATEVTNTAVLNGFTISGGNSENAEVDGGAGILISSTMAGNKGPVVVRCKLTGNSAFSGGGVHIAGSSADPTFVNCSFSANSAYLGGGMNWKSQSPQGATLVNCLFANNTATLEGGAITPGVGADIMNCTFAGNSALQGGAIHAKQDGTLVTNSIFWGNMPDQIAGEGSVTVSYSDVEGGFTGATNIDADPLFVNVAAGNYRLYNVCPDVSPCIDAGSDAAVPCDDINLDEDTLSGCPPTGERLPWDRDTAKPATHWGRVFNVATGQGTKVDMGAYESQHITDLRWDISGVPSGSPPPNGDVGTPDFLVLLQDWTLPCPGCGADFNNSLTVDVVDFLDLLAHWCAGSACDQYRCPLMEGQGNSPESAYSESSESSQSPVDGALAVMGFSGLDDYGAWMEQASAAEAYASSVVLAVLLGG